MIGDDETIYHKFKPEPAFVKQFTEYVYTQKDFKNELFKLMMNYLSATEAYNIKEFLNMKTKKIPNNDTLSANLINCEALIKIILEYAQNSNLKKRVRITQQ